MKILTKLTKRNLLLNKKRTISSIIGIMLSVALICAVSGMFTSYKETLIQLHIVENGYYHIVVNSISKEQLSKYEHNKDVKKVNVIYELGVSPYKKIEKEAIEENKKILDEKLKKVIIAKEKFEEKNAKILKNREAKRRR